MKKQVIATDTRGASYEVAVDSLEMAVHVYGIAVRGGRALVVSMKEGGSYDWPGGTLELGETHLECLQRELREETGYAVEVGRLLNVYSGFFHHAREQKSYQSLLVFYEVKIAGGEISTDGFDKYEKVYADRAQWVELDELAKMHLECSLPIAAELLGYARQLAD